MNTVRYLRKSIRTVCWQSFGTPLHRLLYPYSSTCNKGFAQLIAVWILTKTPEPMFIVLVLCACLPIIFSTLRQMGRMLVLTAPIILLIPLASLYGFTQGDYLNLMPIGIATPSAITKGLFASMFAINGFIVLSIIFPHVKATAVEKWKVATLATVQ